MKVGVGLPSTIPNVPGELVLDWARKTDELGFSSLGTIDRIVYQNYEPMIALTAAAAVTKRIGLLTTVLVLPTRDTALIAKQAATLDLISRGRLTLGLGVGGRKDDSDAAEGSFASRGKQLTTQISLMRKIWAGERFNENVGSIGPSPFQMGGPKLLIGGRAPRAVARAGKWGDGYIGSGMDPKTALSFYRMVEDSWEANSRPGKPKLVSCLYYVIGDGVQENGSGYLRHYYSFAGPMAENIVKGMVSGAAKIKEVADGFASVGADELILWPCVAELKQLDLLAETVSRYLA